MTYKKYKRTISVILLIILISSVFLIPKTVRAAGLIMADFWNFMHRFVILPLTRPFLWALDKKLTNWITGVALKDPTGTAPQLFAGNSLIIGNYRNYGLFSQQRGEDIFRTLLARGRLCPYFGQDLKRFYNAQLIPEETLNKIKQGTLTRITDQIDFEVAISCTMPSDFNFDEFSRDFSKGGWEAWRKLVLEPQNNPFGAFFLSAIEFENQRKFERDTYINTEGTRGFIGRKKPCEGQGSARRCVLMGRIVTPSQILSDSTSQKIDTATKGIVQSEDIATILISVINSAWQSYTNKIFSLLDESPSPAFDPAQINSEFQQIEQQTQQQQQEIQRNTERQVQEKICINRCDTNFDSCIKSCNQDPSCEAQCEIDRNVCTSSCRI